MDKKQILSEFDEQTINDMPLHGVIYIRKSVAKQFISNILDRKNKDNKLSMTGKVAESATDLFISHEKTHMDKPNTKECTCGLKLSEITYHQWWCQTRLEESTPTPPTQEEWEKEFDKKFNSRALHIEKDWKHGDYSELKSFIKSLLSSREQKIREMVEGLKKQGESVQTPCPDGKAGCLVMHYSTDTFITPEIRAYNEALNDILEELNK